jgi:hypothetical protein
MNLEDHDEVRKIYIDQLYIRSGHQADEFPFCA